MWFDCYAPSSTCPHEILRNKCVCYLLVSASASSEQVAPTTGSAMQQKHFKKVHSMARLGSTQASLVGQHPCEIPPAATAPRCSSRVGPTTVATVRLLVVLPVTRFIKVTGSQTCGEGFTRTDSAGGLAASRKQVGCSSNRVSAAFQHRS